MHFKIPSYFLIATNMQYTHKKKTKISENCSESNGSKVRRGRRWRNNYVNWKNTINFVCIAFPRSNREKQSRTCISLRILSTKWFQGGSSFAWFPLNEREYLHSVKVAVGERNLIGEFAFYHPCVQRTAPNFHARSPSNNRENHTLFVALFARTHEQFNLWSDQFLGNFYVIEFIEIVERSQF